MKRGMQRVVEFVTLGREKRKTGREKETAGGWEGEAGVEWVREFDPHVATIV